jgi:hyperosmotically inducible periplasmic protein
MKKILSLGAALSLGVMVLTGCSGDRYSRSTGRFMDDSGITAKVKSSLLKDETVKGLNVNVTTYRGDVQLSGFVDTLQEKQRAGEIASRVEGVQTVKNDLLVKPEPAGTELKTDRNGKEIKGKVETDSSGAEIEVEKK